MSSRVRFVRESDTPPREEASDLWLKYHVYLH